MIRAVYELEVMSKDETAGGFAVTLWRPRGVDRDDHGARLRLEVDAEEWANTNIGDLLMLTIESE